MSRDITRVAAFVFLAGIVITAVAGLTHPDHQLANDHPAVFAEYAASANWTLTHLGQFGGMAVIVAGLFLLSLAIDTKDGIAALVNRFAIALITISLALYAVLQGVDGVALKQAVNEWQAAPEVEKFARLSTAEGVRWLEWGLRSYHSFVFGLALILVGAALVLANRPSRAVGLLLALAGGAYLVQGWIVGSEGFSPNNSLPTLVGIVAILAAGVWLLVSSLRMKSGAVAA